MSEMFAWNNKDWYRATENKVDRPTLDIHTTGMMAGTKVATASGWAGVETIREGQQVLTFDGGLQTVIAVTRHALFSDTHTTDSWPMFVPAGALGNCEDMKILPHQPVMIESDLAEQMTGDPFAVIPSLSLVGYRGITQVRPADWVEVIQLHFAQDEIVFANIGALFLCHAKVDLISDVSGLAYEVMPMDQAEDLVDCLMSDEDNRTPSSEYRYATA